MGKLKEKFYMQAVEEYSKRLSGFCSFRLLELPEYRLPDAPSPAQIAEGLAQEAQLIREKLPKGGLVLRPHPRGKKALLRGLCRCAGRGQDQRTLRRLLPARLQLRHCPGNQGPRRFAPLLLRYDLPPPSGAGHAAGAALSGGEHSGGEPVSQVNFGGFSPHSLSDRSAV